MASFNSPSLSSDHNLHFLLVQAAESFVSSSSYFLFLLCCSAYVDSRLQLGTFLMMVLSSFSIPGEAMKGTLAAIVACFLISDCAVACS